MVSGMRGMMIFWTVVAVLCAVAFGFVTGVFNPEEKVNSLWVEGPWVAGSALRSPARVTRRHRAHR